MKRFLCIVLALLCAPQFLAQSLAQSLDQGRLAAFSHSAANAPEPVLGLAAPSFAKTQSRALAEGAHLRFYANFAAFIDHWRVEIRREGAPQTIIRALSGTGDSFHAGVVWDGTVETGPAIRPGERFLARLHVYDRRGGSAVSADQMMLAARYAMPRERATHRRDFANRLAALTTAAPAQTAGMLIAGQATRIRVANLGDAKTVRIGPVTVAVQDGQAETIQFLPPGAYNIVVAAQGAAPQTHQVVLPGAPADIDIRATHFDAPGPRMGMLRPQAAVARYVELTRRRLALPHTDVAPETVHLTLTYARGRARRLEVGRHYRLRPGSGVVRLTDAGAAAAATAGVGAALVIEYGHYAAHPEAP